MDLHDTKAFTRRTFLHTGFTLASAAVTVPWFLQRSALALAQPASTASAPADGRILVVLQLAGGNDGLNTVVPVENDDYYRARPRIAIPKGAALTLSRQSDVALHPALAGLKSLYDDGLLSVVQGVGYPNPNRSHFTSMDIWHTADTDAHGDGWIGRYFDNQCAGAPDACPGHAGISVGRDAPLAMQGRSVQPVSFESEEMFRWSGVDLHESLRDPYHELQRFAEEPEAGGDSNASFLMRTAMDAQLASTRIRDAVGSRPLVEYPRSRIARDLAMVASMIRAGLETSVYYVSLGGFDTHAGQGGPQGQHANLLRQFADAARAFYADLHAQGNAERVLTVSFSEFGRRVAQNGSNGTDHGAAAPMFLMGPMVRPGVLGRHPSLRDLDQGDLKFNVDFRSVYTTVLGRWMNADARKILQGPYRPANVLRV